MRLFFWCGLLALSILLPGCRSMGGRENGRQGTCEISSPEAVRAGNSILSAFHSGSVGPIKELLHKGVLEGLEEKSFLDASKHIQQNYGDLKSFSYWGSLRGNVVKNHFWKVLFRKNDQEREILFHLATGAYEGRELVLSFRFL